jgi:hypothetical protein
MLIAPAAASRELATQRLTTDLVIVGGGLAGACAAITAARAGIRVILVQDRPVLGGNASSEVRLWILGATSHMGNNNRWAREGGIVDEILVENTFRNPEGNPYLVDSILLEKVTSEKNITLLLNTAVYEVAKSGPGENGRSDRITSVRAFCSQNSTRYELSAPLFCDASGDGVVGFLAGAAFRMGAESRDEFGEKFAPSREYGELLGHSLYFYSKDVGRPVQFTPPAFALRDITRIPRYRSFTTRDYGCRLWWLEYGGRLDTVHDTEAIKWELWRVVYGVWDHIKNSGQFPEAANLTLEWVGTIPGKRESRRFEGDTWLIQQDIVEQRAHPDAIAFGGWSIDLHPADGLFSEKPGCNQWHAKGIYQIPYRCVYSKNIPNLFLAGRIVSASHVAFGSSRVMGTCGYVGEAVGMAAALCRRRGLLPRALGASGQIEELQRALLQVGHHIPGCTLRDPADLAPHARIEASSELRLHELRPDGPLLQLSERWAMMLPITANTELSLTVFTHSAHAGQLRVELRESSRVDNHTPDVTLETMTVPVAAGADQPCTITFAHRFTTARYAFVCFFGDPTISLRCSEQRVTGVLALCHEANPAVAESAVQEPPGDIGIDRFEFWEPHRRPGGQNLALQLTAPLDVFKADNLVNGVARPTSQPNAWVADFADPAPSVRLTWTEPQTIARIELSFDTDFDHPMESVLWGHPERRMPFCVPSYRIRDHAGRLLAEARDNHQTRNIIVLNPPARTSALRIELDHPSPHIPAALFEVRCYATPEPIP